nr:ankyrin repeat domain-containing protein [Azospirillum doebereinerae]
MDRPAPKHTPQPAVSLPDHQASEIHDGLVLALLARKRLLVLVGEAGSGHAAVYRQLVEHIASDGAMVLPVTANPGIEIEDLILEAAAGVRIGEEDAEADFDALIGALEERLDLAGTGLLAVENAGALAPPVLADLVELTRSETAAGRFLQVLLCGTPDLERSLARAGLSDALRELGVIYRMAPGAAPSNTPMALAVEAATAKQPPAKTPKPNQIAKPASVKPAPLLAAPEPAPPEPPRRIRQPANDWTGDAEWPGQDSGIDRGNGIDRGVRTGAMVMPGPPGDSGMQAPDPTLQRPPRRAALYAGAALTTLVLLAAAGAAVVTSVPGVLPPNALTTATATATATVERGWSDTRSFVERNLRGLLGGEHDGEALALGTPRTAHADTRGFQPPLVLPPAQPVEPHAAITQPVQPPGTQAQATHTQTAPIQTAALPPAAPAAALPTSVAPMAPEQPAMPPAPSSAPPAAPANSEAAPGTAALPPLEEPAHVSPLAAPLGFDGDAGLAQRARALVDQARRQIAGKRLTTPPGDNAYETVQRLRQTAPSAPEAAELTATMADTYRRWAALAERDADWNEARRFYERALMVSPDSPDLPERIKAAGERRSLGPAPSLANPALSAPATATPGLHSRESVLALLRNPTELTRALQSGTAPDTRLDNGKTLLMVAAEQGLTDATRILLDRKARTDLRTSDGATAVMYAAWGGYESVVTALADGGADLDATNDDGKTALMAAAARGHTGVANALLHRGVAVDRTTANGWSALMYAANNGHDRAAALLLERGANPYRMDTNGNSALTLGALQGHVQVVEALKPR